MDEDEGCMIWNMGDSGASGVSAGVDMTKDHQIATFRGVNCMSSSQKDTWPVQDSSRSLCYYKLLVLE